MLVSIYTDLKRYRLIYIILCISMMPLIMYGYSSYLLIILFPLILKNRFNDGSFLVLLFSFFYTISFPLRGEELPLSKIFFYSLFPIIIYSCGNILGRNLHSKQTIITLIVSLVFCLAAPGMYFGISDIIGSGELIKITRDIEYMDGKTLSATAYGMMFSLSIAGIGMIMIPAYDKFDKNLKRFLIILSVLAILCTIHIVNRTGLVLGFMAIITTLFVPPYTKKRLIYTLSIIMLLVLFFYIYLSDTPLMNDAVQGYLSREEDSGYSAATGGGRFNRWGTALTQIFLNPIGSQVFLMGSKISYAHNLWLDAGLRGGIIPFLLLIIIGYNTLRCTFHIIKKKMFNSFENGYLLALCVVLFAQAMTEPVIEGVFQYFLFMMFFYGCVSILNRKTKLVV